ncbi:hypothetical protein PGQ11_010320 [Apiospora arundinis]|uniref:Uncharacterized protein n=1 Tax=Apiospora arundinis TaxID=335852 RepID=A0ABR2I9V3_9PEZI
MQFSATAIAFATVLAGLPSLGWADDSCTVVHSDTGKFGVTIKIPNHGIPDAPGLCRGLGNQLGRDCGKDSLTYSVKDGKLVIKFSIGAMCSPKRIENSWWHASKSNKYGAIHCRW